MKISEVIAKLEALQVEHGDIPVVVGDEMNAGYGPYYDTTSVTLEYLVTDYGDEESTSFSCKNGPVIALN